MNNETINKCLNNRINCLDLLIEEKQNELKKVENRLLKLAKEENLNRKEWREQLKEYVKIEKEIAPWAEERAQKYRIKFFLWDFNKDTNSIMSAEEYINKIDRMINRNL